MLENKGDEKEGRKCLYNDALNTFYLWLYGVGHMVKDHSVREETRYSPLHGLLFLISSKVSFVSNISHRTTHTKAFVTPVVENWLEQEIALPIKVKSSQSGLTCTFR